MIFGTAFPPSLARIGCAPVISKNLIVTQLARVIAKDLVYVTCGTNGGTDGVDSPEVTWLSFSNVA